MPALTQPTAAEILQLIPSGAAVQAIGVYGQGEIEAHITAEGTNSVPAMAFEHIKGVLTAGSLDYTSLSATNYPFAWKALRAMCWYDFLKMSYSQKFSDPDCEPADQWENRFINIRRMICTSLNSLGLTSSIYCTSQLSIVTTSTLRHGADT
jgi:hypothetical protein